MDDDLIIKLAADIQCGVPLALDLLKLAGGDAQLVRKASAACHNVEGLKAYIIDARFNKLEARERKQHGRGKEGKDCCK